MERICALALCLLLSFCSATSPPKPPTLTPLNCNETNAQVELATDLINEDREEGLIIRPVRIKSIFEQKLENVPGGALYYIDFEVQETKCSVLSRKKWKDCSEEIPYHEQVNGECKSILYIARPWRILKVIQYNCTLGTVPTRSIVLRCPDCPVIVTDVNPDIKAKAGKLAEMFNQQDNNQTHHFKVNNIERVRTQWMFGQSYFYIFTIKETDCLKTQENVVLENCKFLEDQKAHVGFCTGSIYNTPEKKEGYSVNCEIYDPKHDDDHHHHHHHRHGHCEHAEEGAQGDKVKDNAEAVAGDAGPGEAGPGEAGQGKELPEKCELGKDKKCGRQEGHKHKCHPGHHHPHHPGHRHHHHPGHRHHHHPDHHHHHHHDNHHDHQNHTHEHDPAHPHPHPDQHHHHPDSHPPKPHPHDPAHPHPDQHHNQPDSHPPKPHPHDPAHPHPHPDQHHHHPDSHPPKPHPHDPAHHHHNHTSAEHSSSSEESTDKKYVRRTKGSVHVYYLDDGMPTPPVPTILRLPTPGMRMLHIADFPNEPSPLSTCPSSQK